MKKVLLALLLTCSGCLTASADAFTEYVYPDWNDYGVTLASPTNSPWYKWYEYLRCPLNSNQIEATLTASVNVTEESVLSFTTYCGNDAGLLEVYLDNVLQYTLDGKQLEESDRRHFVKLSTTGQHTVKWRAVYAARDYNIEIKQIGVEKTPLNTVNMYIAGALASELNAQVTDNNLQQVRRLKVVGPMNADDWATIGTLKNVLYAVDLSEAEITEIPDKMFQRGGNTSVEWQFLHSIVLPDCVKKIGKSSFQNCNSDVNIPASLESLDEYAFAGSMITKAHLPETCLTFENTKVWIDNGLHAFQNCRYLTEASLPSTLTYIPCDMFVDCYNLRGFALPQNLEIIGNRAFFGCSKAAFVLPKSLVCIRYQAFQNSNLDGILTDIVVPESVTEIWYDVFRGTNYTHIELPSKYYRVSDEILPEKLTSLRLNSPTVLVLDKNKKIIPDNSRANVTLQVPDFLVSAYMGDTYWANFKGVEGFTPTITDWEINRKLELYNRQRISGNPSFTIKEEGSMAIYGSAAQSINNLQVSINPEDKKYGVFDCQSEGVTLNGELSTAFYARYSNKWYYLVLPYDMKVSEVSTIGHTAKHAIRYYDGANRAENGASGSWRNFEADAVIPAGTGFIFQASKEMTWWKFPSQNNDSKLNVIERNETSVPLQAHSPEGVSPTNKGWNLVGNPYTCYYYTRRMDFPAPITIRNGNNYEAYSPIDDDYVLAPYQAFFVQCPDDVTKIDFLIQGCQMTSEVPVPATAPALVPQETERYLTDIVVSDGENGDRTRIVLNEKATVAYETMRDAAKWTGEGNVPQLYTYDAEGNKYAINERPLGNGIVNLGFSAKKSGQFTISLSRNNAKKVILMDNEEGVSIDLTSQDYGFVANAGIYEKRFTLYMDDVETSIDGVLVDDAVEVVEGGLSVGNINGIAKVFSLDGVLRATVSSNGFVTLPAGCYVVKCNGQATKVVVK